MDLDYCLLVFVSYFEVLGEKETVGVETVAAAKP